MQAKAKIAKGAEVRQLERAKAATAKKQARIIQAVAEHDTNKAGAPAKKAAAPKPAKVAKIAAGDPAKNKAVILAAITAKGGASLTALATATGWKPYRVRWTIGFLRKDDGKAIRSWRDGKGERFYEIEAKPAKAAKPAAESHAQAARAKPAPKKVAKKTAKKTAR